MIGLKELENRFTYHAPEEDQVHNYEDIRGIGRRMAAIIIGLTPDCREQALAVTKIEEAVFWANAAVARNREVKS
jgi:hypothetical protein